MIKIRHATIEDFERFRKCWISVWESLREVLPDSMVDFNIQMFKRDDAFENFKGGLKRKENIFLAAEKAGNIVGIVMGTVRDDGVGHLGFFGVGSEHRGKGVGSSLLQNFVEEAKRKNAHKVWLFTAPSLQSGIRLYVKAGFVPEGYVRRHSYGLDLIFYSKFLNP